MVRLLHIPFTKMEGAGNDFIVLDNRFLLLSEPELAYLARTYCPRRTGVGADGLLALDPPEREGSEYRMRYYNPDGSPAGLCGNGARCLGRFAREAGLGSEPLDFDADAGRYSVSVPSGFGAPVRLFVPPPRDFRPRVKLADGRSVPYIWTGTHHVVIFVDDVEPISPATEASPIRHDNAFAPEGANVNFVEIAEAGRLRVRTFEKGVEAETSACGTGAMAAAVVTNLSGRSDRQRFTVEARGGLLEVGFVSEGEAIRDLYLEGPAVKVFTGMLDVDPRSLPA